jgi:ADP-heptose:LPS heptosyltransferase
LRKRNPRLAIWQISAAADLLKGNADYSLVLDRSHWDLRHSNLLEVWRKRLRYSEMLIPGRYELPPKEHILALLCRAVGVTGRVQLRPWYFQTEEEAILGRYAARQIAIQCVGNRTHETWMANKTWFVDRFQTVVDELRLSYPNITILQLGIPADPALTGVVDLRGATSLRESAAILSSSECFVGTSGFLGHLARAVECRSVIIYGGREHSWQLGYPCNENLESHLECAPCGLWHDCDFGRRCMVDITEQQVIDAVGRILAKAGTPLEVQELTLGCDDEIVPRTYPKVAGWREIRNLKPFASAGRED